MKRLFILALLSVLLALPVAAQETVTGGGVGLLLQKGYTGEFCYSVGLQVPVVNRDSSGYYVILDPDVVYSNRGIGFDDGAGIKEIQAARAFVTGARNTWLGVYANLGLGGYHFTNTDGQDYTQLAYRLGLSGKPIGVYVFAGVDIVNLAGPDIYNINVAVRFLKI